MVTPLPWVLLLLTLVSCSDEVGTQSAETTGHRPDVLLVVLDTVRADRLSTYGHDRPSSPQLDAVAAAGVVFEDVTAPGSWTWPSHASLFTGTPPWIHGAHASLSTGGIGQEEGHTGLLPMRSDLPTLAERFSAAGYRTASLASNRFLDPALGLVRGFQQTSVMHDHDLAKRAVELIDTPSEQPLFLFVNILVAHAPWETFPAPWSKRHEKTLTTEKAPAWALPYLMENPRGIDLYRVPPESKESGFRALQSGEIQLGPEDLTLLDDLYTGGVTTADYLLNQILTRWTATRPTGIVAVTSDHGEYLGERGLWEHGKTVYAQVVDVPLVIAAPGRLAAGQRIGTPVQLQDVHDTLLDLAGLPDPAPASLVRVIEGTSRPGPILSKAWATRVWAERMGGRFALDWMLYRVGNEALILASDGSAQLFDVEQDRGMKVDLSADRPERTKALIEAAKGVYVEPAEAAGEPITLPKDVLEALQAVGYVGG